MSTKSFQFLAIEILHLLSEWHHWLRGWAWHCMEWGGTGAELWGKYAGPWYLFSLPLSCKHWYIVMDWFVRSRLSQMGRIQNLYISGDAIFEHFMLGKVMPNFPFFEFFPKKRLGITKKYYTKSDLGLPLVRHFLSCNWWVFLCSGCQGKYGP